MNYSGPASLADVKADLLLSDEEDIADKHWPPLESHTQHAGPSPWQPHVDVLQPAPRVSTSKRSMDQTSDTSDSPSPAPNVSIGMLTINTLLFLIRLLSLPSTEHLQMHLLQGVIMLNLCL
ncbi:hypothetical protein Pmani_008740 [Petrolisthes manimaculis]|uniref:Uncharacterized protein n=1 Tax=Petrolisthes manimaculis TaxID=1843537 RepID=A0AAE1UJ89_9EUCA|nr:hypothetical protein Pmani_008740 [Petrolisthes manimaculis]